MLEIGFAWGTTTNLLYQAAKKVVGIDKGESYYTATKNYPWIEFHKIDGFDIRSVMALGYKFNKIYIDISGCRDIHSVIKMVNMYKGAFKPELIVVKTTRLKRFVQQCEVLEVSNFIKSQGSGTGSAGSDLGPSHATPIEPTAVK